MVDRIVNLMARSSSSTDKFLARHNSIFFHPSGKSYFLFSLSSNARRLERKKIQIIAERHVIRTHFLKVALG